VVIFFGDLATFEHVMGVLQCQSIERTPWHRFQFVIFVMGLFHLKMACADAIWRIFIEPKLLQEDTNSLMAHLALNHPWETGKIGTNPGFRRMHEVIVHDGLALRLNTWTTELQNRDLTTTSLHDYAETAPTQQQIKEISNRLARFYVAGGDVDIYALRSQSPQRRDTQNENVVFALNQGDIGRVETLFPLWISIFQGTGKHKYSAHMIKFLMDVHFVYPDRLRKAVGHNVLVNPTGLPGKFRGVDWVEESMINLYTKHTFGGSGSNYTKKRVIDESTLIKIHHSRHDNIEQNF
ncbi:hypothetical protein K443DRAFT_53218, partial [Laccaria amethystina LaAM-08-1]